MTPRSIALSPKQALALPLGFTLALLALGLFEPLARNQRLLWSLLAIGFGLLTWNGVLLAGAVGTRRILTLELAPRKQHYVQACAQGAVFLYWGWYCPRVFDSIHLIAAQVLIAYAFDLQLGWSRRDTYTLGFGPVPVILSINLFLLFKEDWFYLQCVMVALGFAAKDLLCWTKEGRRTHIFNPSSFPLAVFSLALILTDMTDITWGQEIAITQFYPPQMYLWLFIVSLPGQYFFGVASMTMAAAVTTYIFGLLYFAVTGTYYFFDSYIPVAVFLGMHLLFTDPSTSPRSELGRLMFGVAYGLSIVLFYKLLGDAGAPTFYDKLLPIPLLNLSVLAIDRLAGSRMLRPLDPRQLGRSLQPRGRYLAYMSIWVTVFAIMSAGQGVGDAHPGQTIPFWQQACRDDRPYACSYLGAIQSRYCDAGSGWACNEFGILQTEWEIDGPGPLASLESGCRRSFEPACANLDRLTTGGFPLVHAPPPIEEYPILLRGSKAPIDDWTPAQLYARACDHGWLDACDRTEAPGRP